jgi:hypothetical protein
MHIDAAEFGCLQANILTVGDSSSGSMTVDQIADSNTDKISNVVLRATKAAKTVSFVNNLSTFNKGITIQATAGITYGISLTVNAQTGTLNAGTGTVTVASGVTLTTTNQQMIITADNIDLQGSAAVSSGNQAITVYCTTNDKRVILGANSGGGQLGITDAEFALITANGMTIGGTACGSHTVTGASASATNGISGVLTLLATRDEATVTFSASDSTFNALSVTADKGIVVNGASILTDTGILNLDADSDSANDSDDKLTFTDGMIMTAESQLTISATTSDIRHAGKLTLSAKTGIYIHDSVTGMANNKAVVMNSDADSSGSNGTLTVATGQAVTSNKSDVTITAWDLDLAGTAALAAGTKSLTIHGAEVDQTYGLGATPKDMQIDDGEFGRLTSQAGLTIGTSATGHVDINGLTDGSTDQVGVIVIVATKTSKTVTFDSNPSAFQKGITVQATGGVAVLESVTTKSSATVLRGGTGYLTIRDRRTLSSTNQQLTITADNIDIQGTEQGLTAGTTSLLTIATETGVTVGLGPETQQMDIVPDELQKVTSTGLTLGSTGVNLGMSIAGSPKMLATILLGPSLFWQTETMTSLHLRPLHLHSMQ